MQIQKQTFLVTGGASGLGAATARTLIAAGGNVIIADLNEEKGAALAAEFVTQTAFIKTNVVEESDVEQAIALAVSRFGALNGAINCAGIGVAEKVIGKDGPHRLASFRKVIEINLIGSFNVLRLSAAQMANNQPNEGGERGVIVNTASVAAYDGQMGQIAYAASKGGIVGMTLPAARDLARNGIRVVTIAPGLFDTPLLAGLPEEVKTVLGQQVPFPARLGDPLEYGALVKHIIENAMLNGEVIRLDGALRMPPK